MKISGFTIVRNAQKFYFPIKQSIESILPLVDEFIIALGDNDDKTEEIINSIQSDKIKIYHRTWDLDPANKSHIYSDETNFALSKCNGDWCLYLQADEVVHEKDLPIIKEACKTYLNDDNVEGLLFDYFHFWGDYNHYLPYHGWYKNEIRVIKNNKNIVSVGDAQSFNKKDGSKLKVKQIGANIYHYGWVRPPELMKSKKKEQDVVHYHSDDKSGKAKNNDWFNYGDMNKIPVFKQTHPKVMYPLIDELFWKDKLYFGNAPEIERPLMKHERLKYKMLSFIENKFLKGNQLFANHNYIKV